MRTPRPPVGAALRERGDNAEQIGLRVTDYLGRNPPPRDPRMIFTP